MLKACNTDGSQCSLSPILEIVVCGAETITVGNSTAVLEVTYPYSPGELRPLTFTELSNEWFSLAFDLTVTSPLCKINQITFWQDAALTVPFATPSINVDPLTLDVVTDLGVPINATFYVKVQTIGFKVASRLVNLQVCGDETIVAFPNITDVFVQHYYFVNQSHIVNVTYQNILLGSSNPRCFIVEFYACLHNVVTPVTGCVAPNSTLVSKNVTTGEFHVWYTVPVNHTFYLGGVTSGQVFGYFEYNVNIYDCS